MSQLVVMGSGETAPTMVRVHRRVFAETGEGVAAMLDTPFGFQRNADELVTRTAAYFAESVGRRVEVARWRRRDEPAVEAAKALELLHRCRWVFAGPGSPSYVLRQWADTEVPAAIADVVRRGGTAVFGSAAAVTLGTHAIPVYEIYKVGDDPFWLPGLDLLGTLAGIHAVVIPHYDNNEGGTHDTRFCYLGEDRLAYLETLLPDDIGVLGVDEHTALILDLDAATASVVGNGAVTVRRRGSSREYENGAVLTLAELGAQLSGRAAPGAEVSGAEVSGAEVADAAGAGAGTGVEPGISAAGSGQGPPAVDSLRAAADLARTDFDVGFEQRDVDACIAAVLTLESALHDWSSDTLQGDDVSHARRQLRAMLVRLGELAQVGARPLREVVGPYVEALLGLRTQARTRKDFAVSDEVRDGLVALGVEVRDTPGGVEWDLTDAAGWHS